VGLIEQEPRSAGMDRDCVIFAVDLYADRLGA
jgi:hypothetical protein